MVDDATAPTFEVLETSHAVVIRLLGDWATNAGNATSELPRAIEQSLARSGSRLIVFDATPVRSWGTSLLVAVSSIVANAEEAKAKVELKGLPEGVQALMKLSRAVPPRAGAARRVQGHVFLERIGRATNDVLASAGEMLAFLGESLVSVGRFFRGRVSFRRRDVVDFVQATGPEALPIVGIINVLLGVILAFMGAVQLTQFGAEIYVANLVALGQTREIAPMMTAIVMAGRTGAAYAAQLGTMQVNEEIDALKTFGFSPMDFLVLPRMLALAIMFPVLVLYADALGILGGYVVGVAVLGLGTTEYIEQTRQAIDMGDVLLGIVKGSVFGILVAVTGCMQGMRSGRSASAVGDATTQAVVLGIIAIIAMTAVFAVLTNVLGI